MRLFKNIFDYDMINILVFGYTQVKKSSAEVLNLNLKAIHVLLQSNIHSNKVQKECSEICTPLCLLMAWLQAINKHHSCYNAKCFSTTKCPNNICFRVRKSNVE